MVAFALLACLMEAFRQTLGIVDVVAGEVLSSRIEGSPVRGQSGKAVHVDYSFDYDGRHWKSTDVYQPDMQFVRPLSTPAELAVAERVVAEHPSGRDVRVVVSRYAPWHSELLGLDGATAADRPGRSWVSFAFAFLIYVCALLTRLGWRAFRRPAKRR